MHREFAAARKLLANAIGYPSGGAIRPCSSQKKRCSWRLPPSGRRGLSLATARERRRLSVECRRLPPLPAPIILTSPSTRLSFYLALIISCAFICPT